MAKIPNTEANNQGPVLLAVAPKQAKGRRRKSAISRGALDSLDRAVEALGTTEEPSRDWQLTRPDAQDEFAIRTRKLVRQIQSELRQMLAELRGRAA